MGRPPKYKNEEEREQAKIDARKRWAKENQSKVAYVRAKSFTKKFIDMSEDEDLKIIEKWLEERKKKSKEES